ncbi:MAG: alanine racemase [Betaproteobacteria bacterium]
MPDTQDLLDPLLGPWLKGFPHGAAPLRRSHVAAQGWNVWAGDLPLPLAVVKVPQLRHNLQWMQDFVEGQGVAFAPHGKTTMSPQLFQAQLQQGAWGITVATLAQLRVAVQAGARRTLIANQVLQAVDLVEVARLQAQTPGLRVVFLLDSQAQLQMIESLGLRAAFEVLVEVGVPGGRTGLRSHDEAVLLARAAHASPAVLLAGVECYEGLGVKGDDAADRASAQALMSRVHALAQQLDAEGLFDTAELIVSAGGSGIFDLVAPALKPALSRPVVGVLRSGCYVTHDDGSYRRLVGAVNRRLGCERGLEAALEVWTMVQSMPEPGLALLTGGRRDLSYDIEMPVPVRWCPAGARQPQPTPAAWTVSGMNDQHAYLRLASGPGALKVGDRVALGISHPCTTFDKWRWMAMIDDQGYVVDALTTCF